MAQTLTPSCVMSKGMKNAESRLQVLDVVMKWHNKPDIFNQFVGDGSNLDTLLRDE